MSRLVLSVVIAGALIAFCLRDRWFRESRSHVWGGAGNDSLTGGKLGDTFLSGLGNDVINGGLGDDTYIGATTSDIISENASEGTDLVTSISTALG